MVKMINFKIKTEFSHHSHVSVVKVPATVRHNSGRVGVTVIQELTEPPPSAHRHVAGCLQVDRCTPVLSDARACAVNDAPDVGFADDVTWRLVSGLFAVGVCTLN